MTASALDAVRGLGEARRKALVAHFGSVAKLREASVGEITAVPGIGAATAAAVLEALGAAQTPGTEPNPAGFEATDDPVDNDAPQAL
jgi:excinuclease ABC subunit C